MTIDELAEVFRNSKPGDKFQVRYTDTENWIDATDNHYAEYRVNREPREWWVVLCGNKMNVTDGNKPAPCPKCNEIIKVREVLE